MGHGGAICLRPFATDAANGWVPVKNGLDGGADIIGWAGVLAVGSARD